VAELLRTNDVALVSVVESVLLAAGIPYQVADRNMSVLEGSIGVIPRRVLVPDELAEEARRLLTDADLGRWLTTPG
jgi:hypothetical protein